MADLGLPSLHPFLTAGIPPDAFPRESWAGVPPTDPLSTDLRGQFGFRPLSSDAADLATQQTRLCEEIQQLNQAWLLKPRLASLITPSAPQTFSVRTPAEKFQALGTHPRGVGALAAIKWVINTSDGGNPIFSQPVVLVLGPLIAPPSPAPTLASISTLWAWHSIAHHNRWAIFGRRENSIPSLPLSFATLVSVPPRLCWIHGAWRGILSTSSIMASRPALRSVSRLTRTMFPQRTWPPTLSGYPPGVLGSL